MGLWNKLWNKNKPDGKTVVAENSEGKMEVTSAPGPKRKYKGTVYMWPSGERGAFVKKGVEPGRNNLCPCGSGKKFKKCCLEKRTAPDREMVIAARIKTETGKA